MSSSGLGQASPNVCHGLFKFFIAADAHHATKDRHCHNDVFTLSARNRHRSTILGGYRRFNLVRKLGMDGDHVYIIANTFVFVTQLPLQLAPNPYCASSHITFVLTG